jgi:nucleotide-binding universal stress UspA family protein
MRFDNILVATDLSPSAESVYRWAAAWARRFNSRITLINVDETSEFNWPARSLQVSIRLKEILRELSQKRREQLELIRKRFEEQDIPTVITTVVGRASKRILDHTWSQDVDLVVMGQRGTRHQRFNLGGTTRRVLRRVRVPTLVVPRGQPTEGESAAPFSGKRLISATAFSAACMMALDATLELAGALEARVDYVHVIKLPVPFTIAPTEWFEVVSGETRDELEHMHAKDLMEQIGKQRADRCTPFTTIGVSVSESLRDLALETGADLIAMPSHSRGNERAPRFGSTTESVAKRSMVPILVFPVRYLEQRLGLAPEEPRAARTSKDGG